ncbi:MAG: hypothetical protein AB7D29_06990 [Campylobacterales bacterium]
MDVVLSYPFSGSLYACFTEQATGVDYVDNLAKSHGYYKTIYGSNYRQVRDLALTLFLMYDNVFIAPADNHMPTTNDSSSDFSYANKVLGLYSDWNIRRHIIESCKDDIYDNLQDPNIASILNGLDDWRKESILEDCMVEIEISKIYKCQILAYGGRKNIISHLMRKKYGVNDDALLSDNRVNAIEKYIEILSLNFSPSDLNLLSDYKQDDNIREYAKSFRSILESFDTSKNPKNDFIDLLKKSIDNQKMVKKISGVIETSSTAMSIASLFPIIGNITAGVDLLLNAADRAIESKYKYAWHEFGTEIKIIKDRKAIENAIESL